MGTVQVHLATPPNQPPRADVAKLLVSRSARGRGVGALLMQHAEEATRRAGKTLLVLDTVTGGDGEKLYTRLGWTRVGVIPKYALFPDGTWCDTTIFWKGLSSGVFQRRRQHLSACLRTAVRLGRRQIQREGCYVCPAPCVRSCEKIGTKPAELVQTSSWRKRG